MARSASSPELKKFNHKNQSSLNFSDGVNLNVVAKMEEHDSEKDGFFLLSEALAIVIV